MQTYQAEFDRLADSIHDLKHAGLDSNETQRQLEILQRQTVRLYIRAVADGALPAWVAIPDDPEPRLLDVWARVARTLEESHPGRLPAVADIGRPIHVVGSDDIVYATTPERVSLWVQHAVDFVRLLAELSDDPTAGAGKPRTPRETWLAEALLLRRDHLYWSARRIAKVVGVDPSTLSRSDEFKRATQAARERHAPPRGRVENGRIDAPADGRRPAVDDDE